MIQKACGLLSHKALDEEPIKEQVEGAPVPIVPFLVGEARNGFPPLPASTTARTIGATLTCRQYNDDARYCVWGSRLHEQTQRTFEEQTQAHI